MLAKLPHFLVKSRHGIYYLRVTRNGKESRKSLGTRDPVAARAAAYRFGATIMAMSEEKLSVYEQVMAEMMADRLRSQARIVTAAQAMAGVVAPPVMAPAAAGVPAAQYPMTLKAGVAAYFAARDGQIEPATKSSWTTHLNRLVDEFQPDTLIHTVTPGAITDSLKRLETAGRALKTIKSYTATWRMVWEWWVDHGHAVSVPVKPLKYGKAVAARLRSERNAPRVPWSATDLDKYFAVANLDGFDRPEYALMPLLALYTGARREALARLRIRDFNEYQPGTWAIHLDPEFDKLFRERQIPLHQVLIDAGLLDYVEDVRSLGLPDDSIFPHFTETQGMKAHYFGRMFGEFRARLGVVDGSDFHAFRTTLISVLALNSAPADPRRAFVGHETEEKIDVHLANYTKPTFGPERLATEVLPFIDFSAMGFAWPGWKYQPGSAIEVIKKIMKQQERKNMRRKRRTTH